MKTHLVKTVAMLSCIAAITACNSSSSSSSKSNNNTAGGGSSSSSCSDAITAGADLGITALPADAASTYKTHFCKYTKLDAPNGKPIHFYAQNRITNEQMVRARRILKFYLTDVPGSSYGSDKSAVWNRMADNNATLIMFNGSDGDVEVPEINGQTLYETENVIEGTAAYMINEPRDAAFEEILHLMHDTGIGVDFAGAPTGVLSSYQAEIRAATNNAAPNSIVSGGQGIWASPALSWLRELKAEGSLTQEYLASVIDTYYGLAGQSFAEGSNDLYQPQTRDQIRTMDPMGWALVGGDSPRKYFSEYVTYTVRVDANYSGTFTLVFDAATKYTHKSQYLMNVELTGNLNSHLIGNTQNNTLTGNSGDNQLTGGKGNDTLDGKDGSDTALYTGASTEYTIVTNGDVTTITDTIADRDGTDTLKNIELLTFSDTSTSL